MIKNTWKTYLLEIHTNYSVGRGVWPNDDNKLIVEATQEMQKRWPGPYTVVEKYDVRRGTFSLDLKFENDKEKTLWLLKHSDK